MHQLSRRKIKVSRSTVQRLHAAALAYRPTIKKPLLSSVHIENRLRWATENLSTDWSKVIYTDESSFWLWNGYSHTWSRRENRTVIRSVKHPQKVHVYGAFCEAGFGKLTVFTGILNAEMMCKLHRSTLLPTARKFFTRENSDWILLEDNDPKHKSRLCNDWKDGNGVDQMEWPPQSPDCKPIENVWSVIQTQRQIFSQFARAQ